MEISKAVILPTTSCNANCRHCGIEKGNETMEDSLLVRLLEDIQKSEIEKVVFTGGEPLQPGYAEKLAGYIKDSKIGESKIIDIFTNGKWADTPESAGRICESLKDAGVDSLTVSFDEFHREYVPMENIANAAKAGEKAGLEMVIEVRSFRSTFKKDVKAICALAEMMGTKVRGRTLMNPLKPEISLDYILNLNSRKPQVRFKKWLKRKFDFWPFAKKITLGDCTGIMYKFGESITMFDMMGGHTGTVVSQQHAELAGKSIANIRPKDGFFYWQDVLMTDENYEKLKKNKQQLCYDPAFTVMPDGSVLPCCTFDMLNNYKKARLGVYPEMGLNDFKKALEDSRVSCMYKGDWNEVQKLAREKNLNEMYIHARGYKGIALINQCKMCATIHCEVGADDKVAEKIEV